MKIQQLEDKLDHKEAEYQQLSAKLSHHQSTSKHGEGELEEPEPVAGNKRYKAWMAAAPRRQKEHETRMGQKAHEVLKDVLLKHHRQSDTKDWHRPAPNAARSSNSSAKSSSEALLQRRSAELDSTVSAKGIPIVDDVVDAATDVGGAVVDGANAVAGAVTDGTGLIGDALTDAYNQAADKVSFVANTVINTVEQAVAILINGFDFSAGCPHWVWPSLGVSNTDITIGFGRQMCEVVLVGQRLTLFDFNWGTLTVPFPAPIAAMVAMGSNLVNCISSGGAPFDIFKCVAVTIGETLLQVVPPFSILTQLGSMLSEFLAFFAELASAAILQPWERPLRGAGCGESPKFPQQRRSTQAGEHTKGPHCTCAPQRASKESVQVIHDADEGEGGARRHHGQRCHGYCYHRGDALCHNAHLPVWW